MRKFSGKLPGAGLPLQRSSAADQIVQCALDGESLSDRSACFALLDRDLVGVHARYDIACRTTPQAQRSKLNATASQIRAILSKRGRYQSEQIANRVKPF